MPRHDTRFPPPPSGDESLATLVRRLGADAATLVRQEIALAKAELRANVRAAVTGSRTLILGAATLAVGALVLVEAIVLLLGDALGHMWLGALIVAVVLLAAGAFLLVSGLRAAKTMPLVPEKTLASLRETGEWAKGEASAARSTLGGRGIGGGERGEDHHPPALRLHRGDEDAEADDEAPVAQPAGSPAKAAELPPLEWPLWKRVWTKYRNDDLANQAAKVAYYFFLSLPPLLMAVFGMAGLFGGDGTAAWLTGSLQRNLPAEAGALVDGFVTEVVRSRHPGVASIGLLLALWAGANVFMALEDTLNVTWGVRCARGFVMRRAVALATLLAVGLLFLAGSAALLAGPAISRTLGLGIAWTLVQYPVGVALVVAAFWIVYYILPNRPQGGSKRSLLVAAAIAAGLWMLATIGFRLYAAGFGSYSKTYGVLAGMIVLLLWMNYTALVILLGGEIGSELERGRRR